VNDILVHVGTVLENMKKGTSYNVCLKVQIMLTKCHSKVISLSFERNSNTPNMTNLAIIQFTVLIKKKIGGGVVVNDIMVLDSQ
jgi:hypothetical protein